MEPIRPNPHAKGTPPVPSPAAPRHLGARPRELFWLLLATAAIMFCCRPALTAEVEAKAKRQLEKKADVDASGWTTYANEKSSIKCPKEWNPKEWEKKNLDYADCSDVFSCLAEYPKGNIGFMIFVSPLSKVKANVSDQEFRKDPVKSTLSLFISAFSKTDKDFHNITQDLSDHYCVGMFYDASDNVNCALTFAHVDERAGAVYFLLFIGNPEVMANEVRTLVEVAHSFTTK